MKPSPELTSARTKPRALCAQYRPGNFTRIHAQRADCGRGTHAELMSARAKPRAPCAQHRPGNFNQNVLKITLNARIAAGARACAPLLARPSSARALRPGRVRARVGRGPHGRVPRRGQLDILQRRLSRRSLVETSWDQRAQREQGLGGPWAPIARADRLHRLASAVLGGLATDRACGAQPAHDLAEF